MRPMKYFISLWLLVLATPATTPAQTTAARGKAIVGGTVVNVDGASIPNAVVVIEGDRIAAVGPAATTKVPAGAQVINAEGRWLVSGLSKCTCTSGWSCRAHRERNSRMRAMRRLRCGWRPMHASRCWRA